MMNVLVVDVGGTNVKILATGQEASRKFPSGTSLTPERMVMGVRQLAAEWKYEVVTIGYPGPVLRGRAAAEPHNLGQGWLGFDFDAAFGCPVKLINDAAMQALGSYDGGKMLFLGLGTGLGSALAVDGRVAPMELGHLPYRGGTFEGYVGEASRRERGLKRWRFHVEAAIAQLVAALQPDYVVLGGGNAGKLQKLPELVQLGANGNAFLGGFR